MKIRLLIFDIIISVSVIISTIALILKVGEDFLLHDIVFDIVYNDSWSSFFIFCVSSGIFAALAALFIGSLIKDDR